MIIGGDKLAVVDGDDELAVNKTCITDGRHGGSEWNSK